MTRVRILPLVAIAWGALIVIRLLAHTANGSGDYASAFGVGQYAAGVIGIVMVVVGIRALRRPRPSQ